MTDETEEVEESSGPSLNGEMLKSYLTFAQGAIRAHRVLIGFVIVIGLVLTALVVKFIPRTYSCTTVLMTVENAVLDGDRAGRPLVGAEGLIMRRENLEQLVKKTGLVRKYQARRPPLLRAKDQIMASLVGPMDDKTLLAVLIPTLESRLSVSAKDDTLEIKVDWTDAATTAEVAKATQDGFLELRHRAEISAFQEKMGILDAHATKMRDEVDALAEQMRALLEAKAEDLTKSGAKPGTSAKPAPAIALRPRPAAPVVDAALPELREKLTAAKAKLSAAEGERSSRISQERAKLDELKLRLTPNHPQVMTQAERLNAAQDVSSELALLRAEVSDMEVQLRQRDAMAKTGPLSPQRLGLVASAASDSATAELLPADIVRLLEDSESDPALSAQMSGAVVRYASLRDEVRGAKLALDTAQAAFNHRYQVVVPVEEPGRPIKPALPVLAIAGILISALLGFALPVLIELRRGVLVERWQVEQFQLPVLADLRLPERTD